MGARINALSNIINTVIASEARQFHSVTILTQKVCDIILQPPPHGEGAWGWGLKIKIQLKNCP